MNLKNLTAITLEKNEIYGRQEGLTDNSTLTIGAVPSTLDSFEVAENAVLRTNSLLKARP
jgi:hypothetical protein